jgi:hypothetical protein
MLQPLLLTLFTVMLAAALAAWYVQVYHRRPRIYEGEPSYLRRESLLLEHEQRYFATLTRVVGRHARVFPKVRLSDLVEPQGVQPEQRNHWMRVQRRCVDFLLCSPNSLAPVLAIDLDTRIKKRRRESSPGGDVLDKALKTADIPLLRVRATREYDEREVLQQIRLALATSQEPVQEWFADPPRQHRSWRQRLVEEAIPTFSRWTEELRGVLRRA